MGYAAVLDANVLYPASLRDTLLRFAAAEFYDLLWSERILDEAERNLVADGRVDESGARRLRNAMTTAFDDAIVPAEAIAGRGGDDQRPEGPARPRRRGGLGSAGRDHDEPA
jgi:hypothetical protein